MIQHVLKTQIIFSTDLLRYIVGRYPLEFAARTPRAELLRLLVNHVFAEGHDAHLERAQRVDGIILDPDDSQLIDPITAMIMESDCMDTADFEDFGHAIKKKRKRDRLRVLERRVGARAKGRVRGKGRGKGAVDEPPLFDWGIAFQPEIDVPHVAPVHPVPEVHPGHSEMWGKFRIHRRQTCPMRPVSFSARCPFHEPGQSRTGLSLLFCTKEMTVGRGACSQLD